MDVDAGIGFQPVTDLSGLVSAVVVHDEVEVPIRIRLGDLLEDIAERDSGVGLRRGGTHASSGDLKGREGCGGA